MPALTTDETRLIGSVFATLDSAARRRALRGTWFEIDLEPSVFAEQVNSIHPDAAREVYRRIVREM